MGMVLSINDEEFVLAAKTTYALLVNGCRLFKTRHLEPSRGEPRSQILRQHQAELPAEIADRRPDVAS